MHVAVGSRRELSSPSNVSDVAGLVASAMSVLEKTKQANGAG
jgi:hypothetical protein